MPVLEHWAAEVCKLGTQTLSAEKGERNMAQ